MHAGKSRISEDRGSAALLRREALRVLCACLLYLAFGLTGARAPVGRIYSGLVSGAASAVLPWLQHFPTGSTLGRLSIRNLEVPVILLACLFLVSRRVPIRERVVRFGSALAFLFAAEVVGAMAWTEAQATVDYRKQGLLLYLPWEFRVLDAIKYFFYDLGMEASAFVLLALTVTWNAPELAGWLGPRPARRTGREKMLVTGVIVAAVVLLFSWTTVRESIPAHSNAHGQFGDRLLAAGKEPEAEAQYRAAVEGKTREVRPWLQLASLLRKRGAHSEAERILRLGLSVVPGDDERRRLNEALSPGLQYP